MVFPHNAVVFEPQKIFNKAIIGKEGNRLIYSFEKLIEVLIGQGLTYSEAVEHIDFNMVQPAAENWPYIEEESKKEEEQ